MVDLPEFETTGEGVGGYIGAAPNDLDAAPSRKFMSWHLPRKQYVREFQWRPLVEKLLLSYGELPTALRYLTLPGDDMLDIHYLHDSVCLPQSLDLEYLGFNTNANAVVNTNTSEYSAIHLERVVKRSDVLAADIRTAGSPDSPAWSRVQQSGPFHAINLDLCDGVGSAKGPPTNYFDLLGWLLALQSSTTEASLLFITTRVDAGSQSLHAPALLRKLITETGVACPDFDAAVRSLQTNGEPSEVPIGDQLPDHLALLIGVCVWLVRQGRRVGLKCEIESVFAYRVNQGSPFDDLASLAFKLTPRTRTPVQDATGISTPPPPPAAFDCRDYDSVCPAAYQCLHVDCILAADSTLEKLLEDEIVAMVTKLGYEETSYRAFAAGSPVSTSIPSPPPLDP